MAMSETNRLLWQLWAQLAVLRIGWLPNPPGINQGEEAFMDWAKKAKEIISNSFVSDGLGI